MNEEKKTIEQKFNEEMAAYCMDIFTAFKNAGFKDDHAIRLTGIATELAIKQMQARNAEVTRAERAARIEARRKELEERAKAEATGGKVNETNT